jgi:hypothetical protein
LVKMSYADLPTSMDKPCNKFESALRRVS